jgi:transposase
MSLQAEPLFDIPELTAEIAQAAFPKGNTYMQMRDSLGVFFDDEQFTDLFSHTGQPAIVPWRLALGTIMQFAENLIDRQTANAVRARIDWKYALSLEMQDAGFHYSVLSEFRGRLMAGGREELLLEAMLACFKEKKLLKPRGKQRTDSTYILAAVRLFWQFKPSILKSRRIQDYCGWERANQSLHLSTTCRRRWNLLWFDGVKNDFGRQKQFIQAA